MGSAATIYALQALNGLSYGMFLFLVASGFILIYGMLGILNLAHASFIMLAAYLGYTFLRLTGDFWLALLIAPLVTALIGMLCERFFIRKVRAFGHVSEFIVTVSVAMIIMQAVKIFWGTGLLFVAPPGLLDGHIAIGGVQYPVYRIFVAVFALAVLGFMAVILFKTRLGMIVRAAKGNPTMVNVLGIDVQLVFLLVFGIGTWLAGLAGVIISPWLNVSPGMADQLGTEVFVVVVSGGIGSLMGALVASMLLGVMNAFGVQFIPRMVPFLLFAFMAAILVLKPSGLFGDRHQ